MNNIGKMYQIKEYYWLLFSVKSPAPAHPHATKAAAAHWGKRLNCNITYVSPNDLVVLLEWFIDEPFKKILSSNGEMGWICVGDSYNNCFEEVKL